MNLLPIDELTRFEAWVSEYKSNYHTQDEIDAFGEDLADYMTYLLTMAYNNGVKQAVDDLGLGPTAVYPPMDEMRKALNRKVADKTVYDRLKEYAEGGTAADIARVAETDTVRMYSTGVADMGKASGLSGIKKRWNTMMDEKVRDTHSYLEAIEVPLGEDFYTYDGDHAPYPGMFEMVSNNANCRCSISLIRG